MRGNNAINGVIVDGKPFLRYNVFGDKYAIYDNLSKKFCLGWTK